MKILRILATLCFAATLQIGAQNCTNVNLPGSYTSHLVNPKQTDPRIPLPNNPHRAFVNTNVPALNKLVVFFPGTDGVPASFDNFCQNAANLGFHALALMYPNERSLASFCALDADPDCYYDVRYEVLTGEDTTTRTNISRLNSIEFRLAAFIHYLSTNSPAEGWEQFLTATNAAWTNALAWDKFALCGHSQGAGFAGFAAKLHEVDRVVMFAGGDFWPFGRQPAAWNFMASATPPDRWFHFPHYFDEGEFTGGQQIPQWEAFGQTQFGGVVDASLGAPPYAFSHTFTTLLEPCPNVSGQIGYHGATVNDAPQLRDANGVPIYATVWTHMLTGPLAPRLPLNVVAESIRDYGSTQGSNGWRYGHWNRTADPNGTYQVGDFRLLPTFSNTLYAIPAWVLSNDLQVAVWLTGARPHGVNTNDCCTNRPAGPELWPVRRWVSPANGPVTLAGNLAKWDSIGGDGVTGLIKIDGVTVWNAFVEGTNVFGTNYAVVANLGVGSVVDFMVAPGANADHDGTRFTATIIGPPVTSSCSVPQLSIRALTNNLMELSWPSCPSNFYQVEWTRTFQNWQALTPPLAAPVTNSEMTWVTPVSPPYQYFRLVARTLTNSPVPSLPGVYGGLTLVHNGITRQYRLNIPTSYTGVSPAPLALILHGHNQTANEFAANQPGLATSADAEGVILVIPDGTDDAHGTGWNVLDPTPDNPVDDVAFLLALIDELDETLNIDRQRVYAGGFSNGGQMCHFLGARTTNVFAAFAAVGSAIAGEFGNPGVLQYQPPPSEPLPVIIVNATNDCKRPFWGGINEDGVLQPAAFESAAHWTNANFCAPSPVITTNDFVTNHVRRAFADSCAGPYPPFNAMRTNLVIREQYQLTCTPGTEVLFVTLSDGGHKWTEAGDNVGFDTSFEVLKFFLRHCRCDAVGAAETLSVPTVPGRYDLELCDRGYRRVFRLQVPAGYNPANPTPLVFALHGGGQTMREFASEHPALFNKCDFENMILVLPEALDHPMTRETLWANKPFDYVVDDRYFVTNLLEHLAAKLNADRARIYLTGFSGGGSFSHYFAATMPGIVAAIAPVCTQTGWNDPVTGAILAPPAPLEPMAVMMVRGTADPKRPYNGGLNIDGVLCRSAADDMAYWTAGSLCGGFFTSSGTPYGLNIHYPNCAGTTEVVLVRVDTMPHLWPDAGDGFGFDANVTVIDFLLRHSR